MKINFFGKKFEINIKSVNINFSLEKIEEKDNKYRYRILMLIITFLFFAIFNVISKNKTKYSVGSEVKRDIIAHKTITYEKDILNEDIKNRILKNTTPEYDRLDELANEKIKSFYELLQELSQDGIDQLTYLLEKGLKVGYGIVVMASPAISRNIDMASKQVKSYKQAILAIRFNDQSILSAVNKPLREAALEGQLHYYVVDNQLTTIKVLIP